MPTYFVSSNQNGSIKVFDQIEKAWNRDINMVTLFEAKEILSNFKQISSIEELLGRQNLINGELKNEGSKGIFGNKIYKPQENNKDLHNYFVVEWTEYEAGWGQRPDGYTIHKTLEDARNFVKSEDRKKKYEEFSVPTNNIVKIYSMPEIQFNNTPGEPSVKHMSCRELFGEGSFVNDKFVYLNKNFHDTELMAHL